MPSRNWNRDRRYTMNENRMKILNMLAQGQITPDEAERLIAALENEAPRAGAEGVSEQGSKPKPKYVRVVVTDHNKHGDPVNMNVRVPLGMLRAGVKLTGLIPKQIGRASCRDRVS